MEDLLKGKGYKITGARLAILDVFSKAKLPLRGEDVYKELKRDKNNRVINEATVYRTLTSFAEGHILKRIDFRKGSAYFELALEHHHHIACIKCDTVEDFESKDVEKALGGIVRNSSQFINIQDHSLELFGFCKKCS